MKSIKFSHVYTKLPANPDPSTLLEVFIVQRDGLCDGFVEYDTRILDGGNYPLPNGKLLVLLLKTQKDVLWTTIRRYTPDKESYYRGLRGQKMSILISEINKSLDDYK